MFDDPKKDLKWLEQQLLAVEQDQEESDEDWFEEEQDWLEMQLKEARDLLGDASARQSQPEDIFRFLEEDTQEEEPAEVYAPSRPASEKNRKKGKEKGIGGLVFLVCLETAGIIAILLWWVLWLM